MSISINTNLASLQAQNYLRITSDFQSKTISRVSSGLRIVNSGDDASGLAIANGYRSTEAVLTQGIRNANDGISQLQIADGGLSNISSLLDRARTLATQSASGTFTGDRTVLNAEFQSVIGEINRQSQAIGLNAGGSFAKALTLFVGGGQTSNGVSSTTNGSVVVDLSQSAVDATSLGLQGVQAAGAAGTDIGTGSTTSVSNIIANPTDAASITNNLTNFYFTGPGFGATSGSNVIKVAVNLSGVTDPNSLVTAVNAAIQVAGKGASQQSTAFANANIVAAINTDATGKQQLTFNSATSAFQVQGGDQVANAFMGNFSSGSTGNIAKVTATAGSAFVAPLATRNIALRIQGAGNTGTAGDIAITVLTTDTAATTVANINTAIAGNTALAATGIQAVNNAGTIQFVGTTGQSFTAQAAGDISNSLGFGSYLESTGIAGTVGTFDYNTITGPNAVVASNTQNVQVSLNGSTTVNLGVLTGGTTELAQINSLNAAFQTSAALRAAGLTATDNAGKIKITSSAGTNFRLNFFGGTGDAFGFGTSPAAAVTSTASISSLYAAKDSLNSLGAQSSQNASNTDVYQFTALRNAGDTQTLTLSAVDASGAQHTLNVALTTANASTLDQTLSTINAAILSSNDSTLKQINAFKEQGTSGVVNGVEGVRFLSAGTGLFKVSLGASPASSSGSVVGLADGVTGTDGGAILTSVANGAGSTADISNTSTATAAVTALANAVSILGKAQAVVGRGQNLFNYSINLAQSQLTNTAAAESRIRDADLAAESANLTKSQILLQAGIAALAQANSAPEQVLSLLSAH